MVHASRNFGLTAPARIFALQFIIIGIFGSHRREQDYDLKDLAHDFVSQIALLAKSSHEKTSDIPPFQISAHMTRVIWHILKNGTQQNRAIRSNPVSDSSFLTNQIHKFVRKIRRSLVFVPIVRVNLRFLLKPSAK